jgi:hypothetical protein
MKRTLVAFGGQFGLFLLMLFLAGTSAAQNSPSGEISQLQQTVRELRDTVDRLERRLPQSEKNGNQKSNVTPLLLTILGAIGTGILAISNSFFQGKQAHDLEQDKLRSNLILKAIDSPDAEERKKALTFYVEAGLLSDPEGKIAKIEAKNIPQAPQTEGRFLKRIGYSDIRQVDNAIVFSSGMEIDVSGAPRAYHPDGESGLDYLANAGSPGNWWALVTDNGQPSGNPVIQGVGDPAPGYYISTTSLEDPSKATTDPRRYVDSSTIPYIVIPGRFGETASLGDLSAVYRQSNGKLAFAVAAEVGPQNKIGIGSIALAKMLEVPFTRGGPQGVPDGITYIVFPRSGEGKWPRTLQEINQEAAKLLQKWGGLDRLKRESP